MEHFDVVVIGAGISGIDAAYHLRKFCPRKSFVVLERRVSFGGTWDLFKYPGVRSDSDMFTFGYSFKPWRSEKQIAPAEDILEYLDETLKDNSLQTSIRYGKHIRAADWSTDEARWHLRCEDGSELSCGFLWACTGYYEQDQPYEPEFKGQERFEAAGGRVVHPQRWTDDIDYEGKRIVVIGSGATAVTLVPSMAKDADHVTMLQRSPTYIIPAPNKDSLASTLSRWLPSSMVHPTIRTRNVLTTKVFTEVLSRREPAKNNKMIIDMMRRVMPSKYMEREEFDRHFTPSYNLGEQRPCLDPDGEFFRVIRRGKASVVTDHIEEFDERGIVLKSGERLDCDLIVTATGLVLQKNAPMATMDVTVDSVPYVAKDHLIYKGCMLSDVPNFAFVTGYFNASWTLKADITCTYVCRVLNRLDSRVAVCTPERGDTMPADKEEMLVNGNLTLSSGYIRRGLEHMPQQGHEAPWAPLTSYISDSWQLGWRSLDDGVLTFQQHAHSRL